jgi:dynactin 6
MTMQAETIIHPRARFDSTQGSILIGRRCIIHERAQIGSQQSGEGLGALRLVRVVSSKSGVR